MKSVRRFIVSALCLAVVMHESMAQSPEAVSHVQLTLNKHVIQAEVAKSKAQRRKGLMFRESLPQDQGMLFAYRKPKRICMWMKNTLIPLSVAFIDAYGTIVNIESMVPHSRDIHCSRTPVYYALEMNRGWFNQRDIGLGSRVEGLFAAQ